MQVLIVGHGKMGQTINKLLLQAGNPQPFIIDKKNAAQLITFNAQKVDVAIEFTTPEAAFDNICTLLKNGIPVVSGSTGWLDKWENILAYCQQCNGAFFYAANFNLAANLFFKLNESLAKLMNKFPAFTAAITEIHHTQKKDAPSGTAINLAKSIIEQHSHYKHWYLNSPTTNSIKYALPITALREGDVRGEHHINYQTIADTISIIHRTSSRLGFAQGAILAAEWLIGKQGVFQMDNLLDLS